MRLRNLTPHNVNIIFSNSTVEVRSEITMIRQKLPRCVESVTHLAKRLSANFPVPLVRKEFGDVLNLPDQEEGVMLIVSHLVMSALPLRHDLCCPSDLVRDEEGKIVGCESLAVNSDDI